MSTRQRIAPKAAGAKPSSHVSNRDAASKKKWGRYMEGNWTSSLTALGMMSTTPFLVFYFWMSLNDFRGSLLAPLQLAAESDNFALGLYEVAKARFPQPTTESLQVVTVWFLFQLALYLYLPGPIDYGQLTPADNKLKYKVNGMNAWVVTHIVFVLGGLSGVWSLSVVHDHWGGIFVWANIFGFALTLFAYVKARIAPTHPEDAKMSGSLFYDMFMGIELNPRITDHFDFKLFFNGRPGIIGWSIINLSFAAAQYNQLGYVSNGMVALNILHDIYIVDFFWNEGWYLRTIDIAHDHFGFYLAWGDTVWLPYMYTLQSHYLVRNPVSLPMWALISVYALAFGGYFIFRSVNSQKDQFRASKGKCKIWGKDAEYIRAVFHQADGSKRESLLLCSGWWGLSRHFNYVGDLMMSLAFCLTCGTEHLLPYFYIIYMTILLVHRVYRDDTRCRGKYGSFWQQYCERVKYKILPFVF